MPGFQTDKQVRPGLVGMLGLVGWSGLFHYGGLAAGVWSPDRPAHGNQVRIV